MSSMPIVDVIKQQRGRAHRDRLRVAETALLRLHGGFLTHGDRR